MNTADILIIIAIITALVLAVVKIVKNKRQGKSSCGCDCSKCGMCSCVRKEDPKG